MPNDLTITRTFNAPRSALWAAWTQPEQIKKWWGPRGYTAPMVKVDLHVGGKYLYAMKSPEGQVVWSTGTYRSIVPEERLVVTDSFSDENGDIVPASVYGMPGEWPLELEAVITFEDQLTRTLLTIHYPDFPSGEVAEQARAGWNESLDKLDELVSMPGQWETKAA